MVNMHPSKIAELLSDSDYEQMLQFLLDDYNEVANEEDDFDPDTREEYLNSFSPASLVSEFIDVFEIHDPDNIRLNPEWLSNNLINALGLRELVDASRLEETRRTELWSKVKELRLVSASTGEYKDLGLLVGLVKSDMARIREQFTEIDALLKKWKKE